MRHVGGMNVLGVIAICGAELVEIKIDTPKGFVIKHESELLVDAAWKSDCEACRAPLLSHMGVLVESEDPNRRNTSTSPVRMRSACNKENGRPYVLVARESDCNDCRAALLIAPVQEKGMGFVEGGRHWESEPMPNADEIISNAKANRG